MVVGSGVPIVVVTHGLPIGVITCGVRFWTSWWEIIAIQIIFIRIYIMDYIAFLKHQVNLSNFMSWMSMCKINWSSFPYFYVWNYSLINLCDEHTTSSIDMRSFMCGMNKILVISSKIILLRMKGKWNVCKIYLFYL